MDESFHLIVDGWWNKESCFVASNNETADHMVHPNHTMDNMTHHEKHHTRTTSPVEEFWM